MPDYKEVFENNRKWLEKKKETDGSFFEKLSRDQHPDYLYIGCSDSRVTAEDMMGAQPGEVFIHRNIANLVNATDLNVMSVIQYAVRYLKVKHIIVCGHYNCGGVKAAMQPKDMGILNPWLRNIRDVYRLHMTELDAIEDEHKRYNRLVELNVQEQCINVIKVASVQQEYMKGGFPTVHGWVFDIHSGRIIDLRLDFFKILKNIQKIYNLTEEALK
jgi:carbonic anhydrase